MIFAITYKPGRILAWPQFFRLRSEAERKLASMPDELREALHIVEADGKKCDEYPVDEEI